MLHAILGSVTFFTLLFDIDTDLAAQTRATGCPHCGEPLHVANYTRKLRGVLTGLPESLSLRRSFSCAHEDCRRRTMPPSLLFMDRGVYLGVSRLLVVALRQQRPDAWSMRALARTLAMPLRTVQRWMRFWRERFPCCPRWLVLRGRAPVWVRDERLPADLLIATGAFGVGGLRALTRTLALLCGAALDVVDHALRGRLPFTQSLPSSAYSLPLIDVGGLASGASAIPHQEVEHDSEFKR